MCQLRYTTEVNSLRTIIMTFKWVYQKTDKLFFTNDHEILLKNVKIKTLLKFQY